MNARQINKMIEEAEKRGRYVYLCRGGLSLRIIEAKNNYGQLLVRKISGGWEMVYPHEKIEER